MAQQQKILLAVCLIIVTAAILAGIQEFQSSFVEADINALKNDLLHIAFKAQEYYHKPLAFRGGGLSFRGITADQAGFKKLRIQSQNENGSFKIISSGDDQCLNIQAIGKDDNDGDGKNLTIEISIYPDSMRIDIINR